MAHFATKLVQRTGVRPLQQPHACVTVEVIKQRPHAILKVVGGIRIAQHSTTWVALKPGTQVVTEDGEVIEPSGTFYVSTETFDPFHLLMDVTQKGVV